MSPEFLSLLRYCLVLALLIHLPFIGMIIGGSAVSLLMNLLGRDKEDRTYLRFSQDLIETVTTRKSVLFLFGILPIFPVALIYGHLFAETGLLKWYYWVFVSFTIFSGFLFLLFYRATFRFSSDFPKLSLGAGLVGHLTLIFANKLFFFGTGIVFNPEKLPFLRNHLLSVISWNSVVKVILFFILFTGITGGAILLFIAGRSGKEDGPRGEYPEGHVGEGGAPDDEYRALARTVGTILTFLATLAIPLFILFNLITLPDVALSAGVFVGSGMTILLSLAVCVILYFSMGAQDRRPYVLLFVVYLVIFLGVLGSDSAAIGNAYQGRVAALEMEAKEIAAEKEKALNEEGAGEKPGIEVVGQEVFERVCTGCHRYDGRLVGPPLNEVLPKYGDDVEVLKGYIRNPFKVDPDYPPMPKLGLSEEEIDAVSVYLLGKS